jgi:small redox-active disulfide protein 2
MEIRIFGPGCARCGELAARTREALDALGRDASVTKVEDILEIAAAGALRTPAMQINGRFVLQGRVPGVQELTAILGKAFDAETTSARDQPPPT